MAAHFKKHLSQNLNRCSLETLLLGQGYLALENKIASSRGDLVNSSHTCSEIEGESDEHFFSCIRHCCSAGLGGYYLHEVIEPRFEVAVGDSVVIRVESRSAIHRDSLVRGKLARHIGIQSKIPDS